MMKFNFKLYPNNEHVNPYEIPFGHIFQAVIFGWLHQRFPKLIHELHSYQNIRPYAINCHIHQKKPLVEFSVVSYNKTLNGALKAIITSIGNKVLNVGGKKYQVKETKVKKIHITKLLEISKPVRHFHISFITPVHFSTSKGKYSVRFPLPSVLFGNLTTIWNDFLKKSAQIDHQDFMNWIKAHCYPSGYRMRSAQYFIKTSQKVIGGQGFVSYRIRKPNRNFYEQINTSNNLLDKKEGQIKTHHWNNCFLVEVLCRLGEYLNVGGNRTAGMGVIRYYPKDYLQDKHTYRKKTLS